MKRVLSAPFLVAIFAVSLLGLIGCEETDVGVPCDTEVGDDATGTLISTDSFYCLSRLCIKWEGAKTAQCTKICENDDDCPEKGETPTCDEGYKCIVPTVTGTLACCRMCVCITDLSLEDRQGAFPAECIDRERNCPKL